MSIAWMSRVWSSAGPEGADRLMLLALADAANDAGVCWPSVSALARKCGVSESAARRTLRRLEARGYVVRAGRPGTSAVFQLVGSALEAGPELGKEGAGEVIHTPGVDASPSVDARPGVDAGGTPSVDATPPLASAQGEPSVNHHLNQQQATRPPAHAWARARGVRRRAAEGRLAAAASREGSDAGSGSGRSGEAEAALRERGVVGSWPGKLVAEHGAAAVAAAVAEWDRRRAEGRRVGAGLLVTLVREGVGQVVDGPLLDYRQMLAACEREGVTTAAFEAVPQPGGNGDGTSPKPLWRRKPGKADE